MNRVTLCFVAAVLLASAVSSGAQANPFMIDTSRTITPAAGQQYYPAVASDGTNSLVVWWDRRDAIDVYGTRVGPDGTVLDPGGIPISTIAEWEAYPDVAFDGANYLVVWEDGRNDETNIYGARVSPAGQVLDDTGFAITTTEEYLSLPAVAFDGTNYLVVWEDERNSGNDEDIYGARVTPGGTVLDPDGIVIFTGDDEQRYPDVAFDGANFLVVWQDCRGDVDVRGARVGPDGAVLDPDGFDVSADTLYELQPAVATDGTNWLVTWIDVTRSGWATIHAARVGPGGTVLDPNGVRVSPDSARPDEPAVTFDGTNFLVVWQDERAGVPNRNDIWAARVNSAGQVLDPDGVMVSSQLNEEENCAIGFDGTNFVVAWTDNRDVGTDVYAARVDQAAQVLDPDGFPVSVAADLRAGPAVAWGEGQWLVVWEDYRPGGWSDIYGARVTTWDTVRDESGFAISTQMWGEGSPAVCWGGSNWLVAWMDSRDRPQEYDIYCARVTPGGDVLDPAGIAVCAVEKTQAYPRIAFDGTNWLVVWEDRRLGYDNYDIYAARVGPGGTILDPDGFNITNNPDALGNPAVCFDGTSYLVAWQDEHGGSYQKIYGARAAPDGTVLDSTFLIAGGTNQRYPAIAHDGTNWLVAWVDALSNGRYNIKCRRVGPGGTNLDSLPLAITSGQDKDGSLDVAFDGFNWLVAWRRAVGGNSQQADILGARVTPEGQVLDSTVIVGDDGYQGSPALAKDAGFTMLMTYVANTAEHLGQVYNIRRVWGFLRPYPGVEEERMTHDAGRFTLDARPNPFCHSTVLRWASGTKRQAPIRIYDSGGRLVRTFGQSSFDNRHSSLTWDGTDDAGRILANGVYFCRLDSGSAVETRELVILR